MSIFPLVLGCITAGLSAGFALLSGYNFLAILGCYSLGGMTGLLIGALMMLTAGRVGPVLRARVDAPPHAHPSRPV